ncbi:MAG: 23S rRNA (uracil(1939)-C(5))-methyltransferase RlmD [Bacteroidetes bacterium]|nr:23S rRNA (uracil(1939)-C(5))-methyltransferase RlmD [Bacteroidota bacterium]
MVKRGDELSVKIIDLNSEGKGITRTAEGFVIFTEKALPGDEALIRIRKKKSNYAEARLLEIINPSPFRRDPQCEYFGTCGGCKVLNYEYIKQLEYKTNVVKTALSKIGGFKDLSVPDAIGCREIYYFRNKMEYSFSDDEWKSDYSREETNNDKPDKAEDGYALGLHVPGFHSKIINIEKCLLQSEYSNQLLKFTSRFFRERKISVYSTKTHSGFLRFLVLREGKNTGEFMLNLITSSYNEILIREYVENLNSSFPGITTIINSISEKKAQIAVADKEIILKGKGYIYEKLNTGIESGELNFRISSGSFFQTNSLQAEVLFKKAVELSGLKNTDNVLDLYCGGGSISLFISNFVNKVLGAEVVQSAVDDANINKELNNSLNTEFITADIKDFLTGFREISEFNKVILDPPRSGLHPKICEILSESDFEKIIYVSCNPHTQARDMQIICSKERYKIENIQPVDMFPHTYHIENIVTLARKE